jgi:hypothetical protein
MPLPGVIGDLFSRPTPEYPVVLCGLDGAGKTMLLDQWHVGNDKATPQEWTWINTVTVSLAGRSKLTFRGVKRRWRPADDVGVGKSPIPSFLSPGLRDKR